MRVLKTKHNVQYMHTAYMYACVICWTLGVSICCDCTSGRLLVATGHYYSLVVNVFSFQNATQKRHCREWKSQAIYNVWAAWMRAIQCTVHTDTLTLHAYRYNTSLCNTLQTKFHSLTSDKKNYNYSFTCGSNGIMKWMTDAKWTNTFKQRQTYWNLYHSKIRKKRKHCSTLKIYTKIIKMIFSLSRLAYLVQCFRFAQATHTRCHTRFTFCSCPLPSFERFFLLVFFCMLHIVLNER